jgi:hypothetical protein
MNRWTHVGALLAMLSLAGCSGESTEGAEADTAKSSKQLKDLTADEVQAECTSIAASVRLSKEDTCDVAGLMSAAFGQSCDTARQQCMDTSSEAGLTTDVSCMPPAEHRAGCTATVAEFEVCAIAQAEMLRALTCTSELSAINTPLPECDAVTQKCPRLLSTGEEQGSDHGNQNP